jgi:hypothetical protein
LYDPLSMPPNLVDAHRKLDSVVLGLFGLSRSANDTDILAVLFDRYQKLLSSSS